MRVSHGTGSYGPDSYYDLSVSIPTGPSYSSAIVGQALDYYRNKPIEGCAVKVHVPGTPSDLVNTGTTNAAGWSGRIEVVPESYGVLALATGYQSPAGVQVAVPALQDVTVTFRMKATADLTDGDSDGVPDIEDNCWGLSNPSQADSDHDCKGPPYASNPECGDSCDPQANDYDNDGVPDGVDNCWGYANPSQADADHDGAGDVCDNCQTRANADQRDSNLNCPAPPYASDPKCGDACDADNDGVPDEEDNCWLKPNPDQLDTNGNCPLPPYTTDPRCGDACNVCMADIDNSGRVNTTDLGIMKTEFFRTNCFQ